MAKTETENTKADCAEIDIGLASSLKIGRCNVFVSRSGLIGKLTVEARRRK